MYTHPLQLPSQQPIEIMCTNKKKLYLWHADAAYILGRFSFNLCHSIDWSEAWTVHSAAILCWVAFSFAPGFVICVKKKKTVRKMCYVLEGRHARYCSWCLYLVLLVLSIISDRDKLYKQNWRIIAVFPRKLIMSKANGPPHMNLFSPLKQGPSVCECNDSRKIPGILLVVMFHAWWCIGDAINQL